LAIALPKVKVGWMEEFSNGLFSCAKKYRVELIGGDTTKGPLSISICILGEVLKKNALLRSNAKKEDDIWVTGELGLAALGLAKLQKKIQLPQGLSKKAIGALEKPMLQSSIIEIMAKLSHSAIDISDGLIADLSHILEASKVGADISLKDIPVTPWLKKNKLIDIGLSGGDDYQLLFTAPKKNRNKINLVSKMPSIKLKRIGSIKKGKILNISDHKGMLYKLKKKGYDHFETK
jgi:thiamine-monophosphate kinase